MQLNNLFAFVLKTYRIVAVIGQANSLPIITRNHAHFFFQTTARKKKLIDILDHESRATRWYQ